MDLFSVWLFAHHQDPRPYFGNPKNRLGSITKTFPQQCSSKINLKPKILAKKYINSQTGNVSNTD